MADASNVLSGALQGGTSGAMIGGSLGGPVGAVIGGALGAVGGGLLGGSKKKYKKPNRASGAVYGYDAYGNLVSKGSFAYNKATGQYELKGGELSDVEKSMRRDLSDNLANLINTVGSTPDAFVRYAKELSDSYYKQGERNLEEQYGRTESKLQENLARRGLYTSRAAADITGELERRKFQTLADIYDASQRYGLSSQLQMQQDARSSLATLGGYQGQLSSIDKAYLTQALNAQQAGQAIENARANASNANIAMQNASVDNMLGSLSQLGSVAGYAWGSKAANAGQAAGSSDWMTQGVQAAYDAGPVGLGSIGSTSITPAVQSGYSSILPYDSRNILSVFYGG